MGPTGLLAARGSRGARRPVLPLPLLLLLPILAVAQVTALQRFDQQPRYTEVNPGEDVKLVCKVFNKRGTCSWQKDNKPVGIYERKYEWAGSRESGDCSLWVRSALLEFDDGEWECQVTASEFTTQDALTSAPVRLVVRVMPRPPLIEFNTSRVLPSHNVSAAVGERASIKCLSRYGNPPARLKWFLGDRELETGHTQSNATEVDNPRMWVATSVLELPLYKNMHRSILRCVAVHESYPTKSNEISVRLDVRYPPEVQLVGAPTADIEEGRDTVELRCAADANPPAKVMWRRVGETGLVSVEEMLAFRPAQRRNSATYTCHAQNALGASEPLSVRIDVKYPPKITKVGQSRPTTAPLYSSVTFDCQAEGNPPPAFQWLQRLPVSAATPTVAAAGGAGAPAGEDLPGGPAGAPVVLRSMEATLRIANVSYDHQGEYVCSAANSIGGEERLVQSEPISLQVVGAPQVVRDQAPTSVSVSRGQDATLRLVVCADPEPRSAAWEWGSLRLEAGSEQGRYRADELKQDARDDCFVAALHVLGAGPADARRYTLSVENERGSDRYGLQLAVREPVDMTTLLSVAAGSLLLLLVVVLGAVYAVRREKCCFARRGDFRPSDLESEKSDVDSAAGRKTPALGPPGSGVAVDGSGGYLTSPARRPPHTITSGGASPDAMKPPSAAPVAQSRIFVCTPSGV